jgi:hypothetical protein
MLLIRYNRIPPLSSSILSSFLFNIATASTIDNKVMIGYNEIPNDGPCDAENFFSVVRL